MNININQLLEKYWKAETSLQDEAELRAYFSGNDVIPEHEQYKDLFTFFSVSRMQSVDLDIEKVLSSVADYDIDALLEKYWNTETSLEEEQVLQQYFASNEIAERHMAYREMFGLFVAKSKETTALDVKTLLTEADKDVKTRTIGSSSLPGTAGAKVMVLRKWAVGLAAIFVLGFGAVTLMNQNTQTQYKGHATVLDEEAEAQEAYEITKEALAFLSKNINKGSKTVVQSVSKAEKVNIFK